VLSNVPLVTFQILSVLSTEPDTSNLSGEDGRDGDGDGDAVVVEIKDLADPTTVSSSSSKNRTALNVP
jgi:hypothetical protein